MYASTIGLVATNGVGIGTTVPSAALDVYGTSATRGVISAPTLSTGQFYNYTVTTTAGRWYKMISTPDFQSKVTFRVRGTVVSGTSPHSCSSIDILISTDNVSGSIYPQISQTDSYTAMSWTDFGLVYVMSTGYSTLYIKAATSGVIVNLDVSSSSKNGSIIPPLIYSSSSVYTLAFGGTMTTLIDTALTGSLSQFDIYTNANAKYNIMTTTNGQVGIGTTVPNGIFNVLCNTLTSQSSAPDGGGNHGLLLTSSKTGSTQYSMAFGVDFTTGYGYINAAGNAAIQPILLQSRGGYVGIGTTNPGYLLSLCGYASTASSSTTLFLDTTASVTAAEGQIGILNFANNGVIGASIQCGLDAGGANNNGTLRFYTRQDYVTYEERMRITRHGRVGIGITNPSYPLTVYGTVVTNSTGYVFNYTGLYGNYSGGNTMTIYSESGVLSASYGFWALSDKRVKKDIVSLSNCLSILENLNPVHYKYIDNIKNKQSIQTGFIAQEVEKVYPFAVTIQDDKEYLPTIYKLVRVEKNTTGLRLCDIVSISDGESVQIYDVANKDYITTFHASTQQLETSDVGKIMLSDNGEVFLYGTLVSDRRILEKDAIFTVGIGAIKELSEQNTQLKSAISALEARLAAAGL